ncbi:MAG: tripartite tricarboxylate transporter substrate binding protein [Xanthobacteraceae bacterium]|nr:tripartite tricarboxylate transporter substrate binding protein [Xanthobacteraceae bacterium]
MKQLLRILVAGGVTLLGVAAVHAQAYPNKPITIVTAFGPGSASDTITRVIAQPLGVALKQNVIVEARPGANGAISAMYIARAQPDGYTLLMTTNSPHSAAPFLMKNIAYDPVKDFSPVSRLGSFTLMLVVHPSIPAKTVKELIDYARANPGKLTFASGNSAGVVGGETLKHFAKLDMLHVPYKSSPQALTDVIAGRVSMMVADFTTGMPHVQSGALRALAMTRIKRSALYPELPTMDEAGVTGFDLDAWAGFVAPAKTPPDVIALLNKEMRAIIDNPETKTILARAGFEGFSSSPQELEDHIKVQLGKWEKMVKDAGIQPE